MKKLFYSFLSLSFVLGLFSCNNEIDENFVENKTYEIEKFSIVAEYKDKVYNVLCTMENDSLVFLDSDFAKLYNEEISKLPNLARLAFYDENGTTVIKYYNDAAQLETKNGISYFNGESLAVEAGETEISTKFSGFLAGRCILYDDTDFKDRTVTFDIGLDVYPLVTDLKPYASFNDKTSAIRVFNFLDPNSYYKAYYMVNSTKGSDLRTCFIGYEDDNFRGKVLYCVATYNSAANINNAGSATHQDYKLKNLGWNDKVTSTVFRIITTSDIGKTVFPH